MNQPPDKPWPPFYYELADGVYHPSGLTRSPWDRNAIAGGPISALLGSVAEDPELADMEIARFTVDIFGKVPHQPLVLQSEVLRDGRQTKLHRIVMLANDRPVAQAHVLRVRRFETPVHPVPHDYPSPALLEDFKTPMAASMAGAVRMRRVEGGPGAPGRGVAWLALDGEIVRGRKPSPFVAATMFADYGNGFGAATHASEWSFANLDINIQFLRMPVGEWILIDAETHMAGNGHGTARSIFADADGVYARGSQTIFVAPGHLSPNLPRIPSGQ